MLTWKPWDGGSDPGVVSVTLRADPWDSTVEATSSLVRALVERWEPCFLDGGEKRNWRQKIGTSSFVEEGSRARARGENGVKSEFYLFLCWKQVTVSWAVDEGDSVEEEA